jgi:hypothetical protein
MNPAIKNGITLSNAATITRGKAGNKSNTPAPHHIAPIIAPTKGKDTTIIAVSFSSQI